VALAALFPRCSCREPAYDGRARDYGARRQIAPGPRGGDLAAMTDIRLVVAASGRMGQTVIRTALQTPGFKLIAGLESPHSGKLGADLAALVGFEPIGVKIVSDPLPAIAEADALIDFT